MKKKHYIAIAVITYFFFLLISIPAKPVTDLINDKTALQIDGVSGTLWNGRARSAQIKDTRLDDIDWSLASWKLLIGQLAADINGTFRNNAFTTEAGISLSGTAFINGFSTSLPATDITDIAAIPLAQLSGIFDIEIESANWRQGEPPEADGVIRWKQARVTVADTVALGEVTLTLGESDEQLLLADISNQGGDIRLSGTAKLLPDEKYTVDIRLAPTAYANDNIKQSLGMFAKKQANGDYLFSNTGSLQQLGLM